MALSTTITVEIAAVLSGARDLGSASAPTKKTVAVTWASGTGANQADVLFADTRTVAASATDSLDLIGGGLVDALGATFAPAKLKAVMVVASGNNQNSIVFARPASNGVALFVAAGDAITLLPGGAFLWESPSAAGVAVTAGTGDLLTVTNGGGGTSVDYDIVLVGTSA